MAAKEQIFAVLAKASAPLTPVEVEKEVGEKGIGTQLKRWAGEGLLEDKGDHHYVLTDKGRDQALKKKEFVEDDNLEPLTPGEGEKGEEGSPKIAIATTEKQQFLRLGKLSGVVPLQLIHQTADYVWEGGDYKDMNWVAKAMQELGLDKDVRTRWWHCWRAKMHQGIPADLPAEFLQTDGKKPAGKEETKKEGAGLRDYVLNDGDGITRVGPGLGDYDYQDALDTDKLRMARRKDAPQAASTGSMATEIGEIFAAFQKIMGDKAAGKNYVIKPSAEGYAVEEVEPGKPLVIPQTPAAKPAATYYVDSTGKVQEIPAGQPVVIMNPPPAAAPAGSRYLIDKRTGEMEEISSGQPMIIKVESGPAQSQLSPIQMIDKDGKPMILDLGTYIKLEDHRDNSRRQEESHQTKMDIAKEFKSLLKNAAAAASHMIEKGEEEAPK